MTNLQPMTDNDVKKALASAPKRDRRPMSAQELRQMAETADGYRDDDLYLVYFDETQHYSVLVRDDLKKGMDVVLRLMTESLEKNRIKPDSIVITVAGKPYPLHKEYDAVFWTESSIEKFLLPYYAAARVLDEKQLARLRQSYDDENVVAMLHTWPTRSKALRAAPNIKVAKKGSHKQGEQLEIVDVVEYLDMLGPPTSTA